MSKSKMGFKPQMNPESTFQPPKDQGKLDICCQFQWQTQGTTCGRWFSHSKPHVEHLLRSSIPEPPKSCHINRNLTPETHQLSGVEGGDKPVLVLLLSWEISIKQQQICS